MHYNQHTINTKPKPNLPLKVEGAVWIPLSKGKFALVDDEDSSVASVINWYAFKPKKNHDVWYAASKTKNKYITLHRLIAERMGLSLVNNIDHKDRDGLNCRRSNLREADTTQNNGNSIKPITNTSGFKGVSLTRNLYWRARIHYADHEIFIGHFPTAKDAALAYDKKALELFGEFALTNKQLGLL